MLHNQIYNYLDANKKEMDSSILLESTTLEQLFDNLWVKPNPFTPSTRTVHNQHRTNFDKPKTLSEKYDVLYTRQPFLNVRLPKTDNLTFQEYLVCWLEFNFFTNKPLQERLDALSAVIKQYNL